MLIDEALAAAVVAEVFPEWADLPVSAVVPGGHDNRTFRLGDGLAVRMPSAEHYAAAVAKEQRWLPELAPLLPLPIPAPVGLGRPAAGYPWPWSVNRWLTGRAAIGGVGDPTRFACDLAGFLGALRAVDADGGPAAGPHNFFRGGDLHVYEGEARDAIAALDPQGARWATAVLDRALSSRWTGAPVWVHGDVAAGNLLVDADGALSAVIDFGGCGVGDPACDLVIGWALLEADAALAFRRAAALDDDTWDRAAGWALWKALITPDDPASRHALARLREDLPLGLS